MFIQRSLGAFRVDHMSGQAWMMDSQQFRASDTIILGGPAYDGCLKLQFDYFLGAITVKCRPRLEPERPMQLKQSSWLPLSLCERAVR